MIKLSYVALTSDPAELLDATRFPNQGAVEHHLLEAFIPAAYRDAPSHPETPLIPAQGQYQSEQARRWLTFLARQMNTVPTRDLAWWQLADTIPRATRGTLVGLAAGLVFGLVGVLAFADVADPHKRLPAILMFGLAFSVATGFSYALNKPPEPLRIEMRFRGTLSAFLRRFAPGLAIGVVGGFGMGLRYPAALAAAGLALGFLFAISVWLDTPADVTQVPSPQVAMPRSLV